MRHVYPSATLEPGTHGDMFGSLNALFTALAFLLLVYTAWLQRQELGEQRRELVLTRQVLNEQRNIANAHLKLLSKESARREELHLAENSPQLMLRPIGGLHNTLSVNICNGGAAITDLLISEVRVRNVDGKVMNLTDVHLSNDVILDRGSAASLALSFEGEHYLFDDAGVVNLEFKLSYTDALKNRREAMLGIVWPVG